MDPQKNTTAKPMSKILKFLPRATSSVSFQSPQIYSPAKDKKPSSEKSHKSTLGIGFSGPMVSIVPPESRRKIKNNNVNNDSTYTQLVYEPTSPRVSCMGQVKCKHYRKLAAAASAAAAVNSTTKFSRATSYTPVRTHTNEEEQEKGTKIKKKSGLRRLFRGGATGGRRKSDVAGEKSTAAAGLPRAPSLGKMKRFSSGRDAFTNFDWTTQVTPLDCGHRSYYTDDERDGGSDGDEVVIPSSAPVMERNIGVGDNFVRVAGVSLEPRKEINLWKRRTMAQPKPLQLHVAS